MMQRRNKNRGYQHLYVWGDAIESADSVHRNIAEGYCRRSLNEYIQFLYIALASLGEFVSGYYAFKAAEQINAASFEILDALAFKLENGLLKLVESLERKREQGDWIDTLIVRESNESYASPADPADSPTTPTTP